MFLIENIHNLGKCIADRRVDIGTNNFKAIKGEYK